MQNISAVDVSSRPAEFLTAVKSGAPRCGGARPGRCRPPARADHRHPPASRLQRPVRRRPARASAGDGRDDDDPAAGGPAGDAGRRRTSGDGERPRRPRRSATTPAAGSRRRIAAGVPLRRQRGAGPRRRDAEIERYLKRGAVLIAEQKFGVECDAPAMQRLYELARGAPRAGADALAVRDVQSTASSGSTRCSRNTRG